MNVLHGGIRVHGKLVTELPPDLYIPPDALEVYLETFEGPLDLLLYLIRKHNLDILDIPMATLTRQYMDYVDQMRVNNLELASDYLLMSAMLIEIKSRMLLPRPAEVEQEDDPRAELVRRLLEYESIKLAALKLDNMPQVGREILVSMAHYEHLSPPNLPGISMESLMTAWQGLMQRAKSFSHHRISREQLSVREHMTHILRRINLEGMLEFSELFEMSDGIPKMVTYFLALLELAREGLVKLTQSGKFAPIHIQTADIG